MCSCHWLYCSISHSTSYIQPLEHNIATMVVKLYLHLYTRTISDVLSAEPFLLPVHLWTFFVKEKASRRCTGGHSSFSQQAM